MVGTGRARSGPLQRRVLPALAVLALLLLIPPGLAAELQSTVTLTGYMTALYSGDPGEPVEASALLESSLNLDSTGNANVKGYFQLDSWIGETTGFDIPRAYLKVRLPWFRLTLGKTRLSWGDGFVFNAGDVLFGSMGAISGDLSGETLRPETGWLSSVYLPLGAFSYLEAVVAPYGLPAPVGSLETDFGFLARTVQFDQLCAGIRGVFKIDALKTTVEAGYYAAGAGSEHRPYLSLHGHLLVDWNLSASMAVPMHDPRWGRWEEWTAVSAGVFHLANLGLNRSLSVRLEAALRPGALWKEASGVEAKPADDPEAPVYGLYLFPELAFSPTDTLSLQLRSLVSPVDLSALSVAGLSWNLYQGLDVFSYLSIMSGDGDDLYGLERRGGVSWTTGLEFIY